MYHICCFFYIYPLNGYQELNSFEESCITLVATITFLGRELKLTEVGEDIHCHPHASVNLEINPILWKCTVKKNNVFLIYVMQLAS